MQLSDEPYLSTQKKDDKVKALPKRSFSHEITKHRFAAASISKLTTILDDEQLRQCANAYTNNGVVRSIVDRSVFFIQGERTDFTIEPNDEVAQVSTDEDLKQLEQDIADGQVTIDGETIDINELRRKIIRINKRVKLHDAIEKFLVSCLVFGRNGLEIIRDSKNPDWSMYGEPLALIPLYSRDISDVSLNSRTLALEGFIYNTDDPRLPTRLIKSTNLIAGFHNDNSLYKGTYKSGLSAVWPILSVAQTDDVINDEDMPEAARSLGAAYGFIKTGTNDKAKNKQVREQLEMGTWLILPDLPDFAAEVHDIGRDLMELPNVRIADAKYMCMCMSLPLFLLFEDTANFATANQVMQVYKAGVLKRYRTWLQGILEDYWYDTILADHLGIDVKDVISAPIKIKATFADINFETRGDIVAADKILHDIGVFNEIDIAKDIDRKDVANRLEEEAAQKAEVDSNAEVQRLRGLLDAQNQQSQLQQQQQGGNGQGQDTQQKQPIPPQFLKQNK